MRVRKSAWVCCASTTFIVAQNVGPVHDRSSRVSTFSGGCGGDKAGRVWLNGERGEEMGMLAGFFSEECDEVEAGRASCVAAPFGQRGVSSAAFGSEHFESSEQQRAISRHRQRRLFGNRGWIPELGLPDAQGVLLLAMVDFDLPAVEVDLQELPSRTGEVRAQQKSGLAVVQS